MDNEGFRELLEKIDPSFRKARLEAELDGDDQSVGLKRRFLAAYQDAQAQSRLVKRHEKALKDLSTPRGSASEEEQASHRRILSVRQATMDQARENERVNWLYADHLREEVERVMEQLEEFNKAGLPPKPAEDGAGPKRRTRRGKEGAAKGR